MKPDQCPVPPRRAAHSIDPGAGAPDPVACGPLALRALGTPPAQGVLRTAPEDFLVSEELGFEPDGEGSHWLVRVCKRGLTTREVVVHLAALAGARPRDIGYAGLKDRRAVTEQWLSVPAGERWRPARGATSLPGLEILAAAPHRRKLRPGVAAGNRFEVRIRAVRGDPEEIAWRLERIGCDGFPNYFGPQRFGGGARSGQDGDQAANVARARAVLGRRGARRDRFLHGMLLSAARAELFNRTLALRVAAGNWNRAVCGDLMNLAGSRSRFLCEDARDPAIAARLAAHDIHPTGPLWGAGDPGTTRQARCIELAAAAAEPRLRDALAREGVRHDRRALRAVPEALEWTWQAEPGCKPSSTLRVAFGLPAGCFATVLLREALQCDEAH